MSFGMDYQGDQSGGFNNSGGGLTPNASQGGASSKAPRKAYDEQTLIAVTCKMILQASSTSSQDGTGALALPDGRTLHHVKLVGAVRSVENLSTNISYDIEDGTGLVTVKQWMDDNDSSALQEEKEAAAKDAQYLKIVGQIKDYDGKKSLVAHSIRKINSGDEITHHMLEVVYSAEKYQRAERIGGAAAPVSMQQHHQMNSPLQQQQQQQSGGDDGLKDQVLNYIKVEGEKLEVGAAVPKLVQMLTGKFTESQVRASIEDLASEGHIYSTINEDQYKFAM